MVATSGGTDAFDVHLKILDLNATTLSGLGHEIQEIKVVHNRQGGKGGTKTTVIRRRPYFNPITEGDTLDEERQVMSQKESLYKYKQNAERMTPEMVSNAVSLMKKRAENENKGVDQAPPCASGRKMDHGKKPEGRGTAEEDVDRIGEEVAMVVDNVAKAAKAAWGFLGALTRQPRNPHLAMFSLPVVFPLFHGKIFPMAIVTHTSLSLSLSVYSISNCKGRTTARAAAAVSTSGSGRHRRTASKPSTGDSIQTQHHHRYPIQDIEKAVCELIGDKGSQAYRLARCESERAFSSTRDTRKAGDKEEHVGLLQNIWRAGHRKGRVFRRECGAGGWEALGFQVREREEKIEVK